MLAQSTSDTAFQAKAESNSERQFWSTQCEFNRRAINQLVLACWLTPKKRSIRACVGNRQLRCKLWIWAQGWSTKVGGMMLWNREAYTPSNNDAVLNRLVEAGCQFIVWKMLLEEQQTLILRPHRGRQRYSSLQELVWCLWSWFSFRRGGSRLECSLEEAQITF